MTPIKILIFVSVLTLSLNCNAQIVLNWQKLAPLSSTARGDFGSFVIDSFFYVVGGVDDNYQNHKEVWRYNINDNSWSELDTFIGGIIGQTTGFSIGGKGYICTGLVDSNQQSFCSNKLWEFNPIVNNWTRKSNFLGYSREGASSFTYNGNAYLGLGFKCTIQLNDIWKYDAIRDTWIFKDTIPDKGRDISNIAVVDSNIFILGGRAFNNELLEDSWSYNLEDGKWKKRQNLPQGKTPLILSFSFKKALVQGFGVPDTFNKKGNFYLYNPQTDTYTPMVSTGFFDSIGGGATFVFKNRGYFFGGYKTTLPSFTFSKDMYSFDATQLINYLGVEEAESKTDFKVYPNPIRSLKKINVLSSEIGEIVFFDDLGEIVFRSKLKIGLNIFDCADFNCETGLLLYKAVLQTGKIETGKISIIK